MTPPGNHEEILAAVLAGDLPEDDETVRRLVGESPEFARRLEELKAVRSKLSDAGSLRREILREEAAVVGAPGEERVGEVIREQARLQADRRGRAAREKLPDSPGRRRLPVLVTLLLAAAALLLAVLLWTAGEETPRPPRDPDETLLGPRDGIEILRPKGGSSSFASFAWSFSELPSLGSYEVTVYDGTKGEPGEVIGRSGELREPRWTPNEEDWSRWSRRIFFEVIARDGNGAPVGGSGMLEAWR